MKVKTLGMATPALDPWVRVEEGASEDLCVYRGWTGVQLVFRQETGSTLTWAFEEY